MTHLHDSPFHDFSPRVWSAGTKKEDLLIYSVKRDHAIASKYLFHNPNDELNYNKSELEKVILSYSINKKEYPLYVMEDLISNPHFFEKGSHGTLMGDIAERISRRITKYFLKNFDRAHGKTGGIFDKRFNPKQKENYDVAHTQNYILKIQKYPNLVILKNEGRTSGRFGEGDKFGYRNIKEIDGLFDYRYFMKRHILILESKLSKLDVDCQDLKENLFSPMRELIPNADFSFILFSDRDSIYKKRNFEKRRQLKDRPIEIYESLREAGINTLFFTFNESKSDFEKMREHLTNQFRIAKKMDITLHHKTIVSPDEITIFDGGETPYMKLVRNKETSLWKEMPLKHKKKVSK